MSGNRLDIGSYFCKYRNMPTALSKKSMENVPKYADMLSAMGTEPRLRIMQLLLSMHPDGLVVSDIQSELDIPNSTLSHHLDKLKSEEALRELLQFLYAECCTRNQAVKPQAIIQLCK
jgi:DNA-binding transcriptional ArsR family regulator